ncbi:MAG: kynureninase [Xanthomonadaceae bacterium]|jgi:kynureninase|nr:kynureninase [Xanthomonadaceae bacterium]
MNDDTLDILHRDAADPLAGFRDEFLFPRGPDGREVAYFTGNSLGLQPRAARSLVEQELQRWAGLGVEGHFRGEVPWMDYHAALREPLAELAGALPHEVVVMNTLTVNLHLMMVSFYRPTAERPAILIEKHAFPSDRHAVESQVRFHGFDPATALIELEGDGPGGTLTMDGIARALDAHGHRIALVLLPGVQYLTGQRLDLGAIAPLAHRKGCVVGYDLAHAIGNVPVDLHASHADFAVWCSYKYLNGGPGAIAGCFVHERHARTPRPRFAGWWGHEAATRFRMGPDFVPAPGADGWQLSNPPILAMAPLRAALAQFQRAGLARLREKSIAMTAFLAAQVRARVDRVLEIRTPDDPTQRGCQLSLRVRGHRDEGRSLHEWLEREGIVVDWREPDVIRAAPVPLYNRLADCARLVDAVEAWSKTR